MGRVTMGSFPIFLFFMVNHHDSTTVPKDRMPIVNIEVPNYQDFCLVLELTTCKLFSIYLNLHRKKDSERLLYYKKHWRPADGDVGKSEVMSLCFRGKYFIKTGKGYTFFQIVPRQPKEANDYACAAFHLATQGLNILSKCEKHRLVPVFQSDFVSPFAWTLPKPVNIHNSVHFLSLFFISEWVH